MTQKQLKEQLQSILELLGTAKQDAVTSSYNYSEKDVNARMAYQVGYLGGRIEQATNDLLTIVDGMK